MRKSCSNTELSKVLLLKLKTGNTVMRTPSSASHSEYVATTDVSTSAALLKQHYCLTILGPSGSGKVQHAYQIATAMGIQHVQMASANKIIAHLKEPIVGDIRDFSKLNPYTLSTTKSQNALLIIKEIGYLTFMEQVLMYAYVRSNTAPENPMALKQNLKIIMTSSRVGESSSPEVKPFIPFNSMIESSCKTLSPLALMKPLLFEICQNILKREASRLGKTSVKQIDTDVLEAFASYDWPGNIRELENVIKVGVAVAKKSSLTKSDLGLFFKYLNMPQAGIRT